jgi:hypothetical protein
MQAVSLVTGDEFLVPFNLTIDTEDVLETVQDLCWIWYERLTQHLGFDDFYGVNLVPLIGSSGYCFTFNIVEPDELFHKDKCVFFKLNSNEYFQKTTFLVNATFFNFFASFKEFTRILNMNDLFINIQYTNVIKF